jgi:dTDP-4-dehydrorhamnose reductase
LAQGKEDPLGWLTECSGLYHLAGLGHVSRFEWARAILEMDPNRKEQSYKELIPLRSEEFHSPAKRPLFSALDIEKFGRTFGVKVHHWKKALKLAMEVSA